MKILRHVSKIMKKSDKLEEELMAVWAELEAAEPGADIQDLMDREFNITIALEEAGNKLMEKVNELSSATDLTAEDNEILQRIGQAVQAAEDVEAELEALFMDWDNMEANEDAITAKLEELIGAAADVDGAIRELLELNKPAGGGRSGGGSSEGDESLETSSETTPVAVDRELRALAKQLRELLKSGA